MCYMRQLSSQSDFKNLIGSTLFSLLFFTGTLLFLIYGPACQTIDCPCDMYCQDYPLLCQSFNCTVDKKCFNPQTTLCEV